MTACLFSCATHFSHACTGVIATMLLAEQRHGLPHRPAAVPPLDNPAARHYVLTIGLLAVCRPLV